MGKLEKFADTYMIIEELGSGSGGIVYKAYHKRLEKEVVLKQIKHMGTSMMFNRQEVDILKNLQHSFLPQVLDFLEDNDEIYTVMSYVPGKSFQQLIDEGYKFKLEQLVQIGMQLSSALNYLHSQHPPVIHGDIKPANIMLTPQGNICLIDFNISFFLDGTTVLGYTHGYTSPEQFIHVNKSRDFPENPNYSVIDTKTDIYSVGATLYRLATGKKRKSYHEPLDRDLLLQNTSESFTLLIEKAMKNDPKDRFPSALKMFQAFKGAPKKDLRYQRMLRKQRWISATLVGIMALFIITTGIGVQVMGASRVEEYNAIVERQRSYREKGAYEDSYLAFRDAVSILPTALEGYYQMALTYHQQRRFADSIDFISHNILGNSRLDVLQPRLRDIYFLKADSHLNLGNYQEATLAFERVFRLGERHDLEHYRGYAVALVHSGEPKRAQEVLKEATALGMSDDMLYYVQGEIALAMGLLESALKLFLHSIEMSQDNGLIARAYVMSSYIFESMGEIGSARDILVEATWVLPPTNQLFVLERLIQMNLDLAQDTDDLHYLEEAVNNLLQISDMGWGTYETYHNLAVLSKNLGEWDNAANHLNTMRDRFGNRYSTFMRLAFLELELQGLRPNYERNYSQFMDYYYQAESLYEIQRQGTDTNPEMIILRSLYEQVVAGGW